MGSVFRNVEVSGERLVERAGSPVSSPELLAARAAGYEEGYIAGMKEGLAEAGREMGSALEALEEAARSAASARQDLGRVVEEDAVRLALEVAGRIIHRRCDEDRDVAVTMVREALRRIADRSRLVIRVHPDDLAQVARARSEWEEACGRPGCLEIVADRRVSRGGAEVVFPGGVIDARIETQIAEAARLAADDGAGLPRSPE